jgi:hypothetical protein
MDRVNGDIALGIRTQCHMVDGWQGFVGEWSMKSF